MFLSGQMVHPLPVIKGKTNEIRGEKMNTQQRWWTVTNRAGDTMTVQAASPKEAAEIAGEKLGTDLVHIGHGTKGEK